METDYREQDLDKEEQEIKKDKTDPEGGGSKGSSYEDVCFVCHRPESKAGKMIQ